MSNEIMLLEQCDSEDLGSRHNGKIIRQMITGALEENPEVEVDFTGINLVTQGFIDEMVGVLIRRNGLDILQRIRFLNCSPAIKSVICIVAGYSSDSYSNSSYWQEGERPAF